MLCFLQLEEKERCVKDFILLTELQGKWLKEMYSTVQNIVEKILFRLACISTLRLEVGEGTVEIILFFYSDLAGEGVFSKIQLGQRQMICS